MISALIKDPAHEAAGSLNRRFGGALLLLLLLCWPCVYLGVDAQTHCLQSFQPLLGLRAPNAIRIECDSLLVGLLSSRLQYGHHLIALLLELHRIHERRAKQIPRLRVLRIGVRSLLER